MDVIGLVETWEMAKETWEKRLRNWKWKSIQAVKQKKGRAMGGIVLGIKEKKDMKVEWKEGYSREIIGILVTRGGEKYLIVVVYMNKEREKNYEILKKWVEEEPNTRIIMGVTLMPELETKVQYGMSMRRRCKEKVRIK